MRRTKVDEPLALVRSYQSDTERIAYLHVGTLLMRREKASVLSAPLTLFNLIQPIFHDKISFGSIEEAHR